MLDILVTAIQVLGVAFIIYGAVLCNRHKSLQSGTAVDDARETTFAFINANDYEPGFRQLAMRHNTVTEKLAAKKLAVA